MEAKCLKDCNVNDNVRLWSIGTCSWDDIKVKILSIDTFKVVIEYPYPFKKQKEFLPTTVCRIENI